MERAKSEQPSFQVGIVLAAYNCDRTYFKQQLESIKLQTFSNWICLITDDGSAPDIQDFIRTEIADDARFIYYVQPQNLGAYHNFESGIEYFSDRPEITHLAFSDQDDIWHPEKLETLLREIESQDALLAHSDLELIDSQGQLLHSSVWDYEKRCPENLNSKLLLLRNSVTGCTVMIRRILIPDLLPFPKQHSSTAWYHDHWMALVASHRGNIAHLRQPLVQYRQHGDNVVGAREFAGTIRVELEEWLAKRGRLTLKSYSIHEALSRAFYQRFYPPQIASKLNPIPENRIDFGWPILQLGVYSVFKGYGARGCALRLWVNKFVLDWLKVKDWFFERVLIFSSK
ncbi:glycosyltransferase family 2 protein [Leptolyngbya iicbica]|uniref:Glycosyltransferase family 2 protein n=2 Tax=Cyanophyceae TaxID=3028117 RepID=A0A4Q7E9R3_9CYAN|nr:glycosyltransferase family 2 protein [Leptolyngbya sp. LK]RZM79291.1 glycosyltransferase family 2 protein [Leptolyngbya sp. LK]